MDVEFETPASQQDQRVSAGMDALAIESGSGWITTDGDFARFPGLRWRRLSA